MSFHFNQSVVDQAKELAALEAFTPFATLKRHEAFKKVEESFAKRMEAADIKMLKLVISIPSPKTYEYEAISAKKKEVKGEDFKFVWQILRGTNSYRKGLPKWNVCTITVIDGKIKNIEFKKAPALLKKFQAAVKASKASNEEFLEMLDDLYTFDTACEELDAYLTKSVKLQNTMRCLKTLTKLTSNESLDIATFFTNKLCGNEKPSVETIGERIKEVWEKVKSWVLGVFSKIGDIFNRLIGWSSAQRAKNDAVLMLYRTLGPKQVTELMRQAKAKLESNESMSVAEMFANQCIISVDKVESLMTEALNISTKICVDEDLQKYKNVFRDVDNMSASEGETYINSIGEELDQKIKSLQELVEHEKNNFYEVVLKEGDNYDTFYDAGWKDVSTVERVFKKYDSVKSELDGYRATIADNIKQCNAMLNKVGQDLDSDDMLFSRKVEILKSVVRLELIKARSIGMSLSYSVMIIEKCRAALARAIA